MELSIQVMKRALVYEHTKDLGKNFTVSPLSCTILLSMVASGLKGEALEQMMFFLRLKTGLKSIADLISESRRVMAMVSSVNIQGPFPLLFSSVNGAWVDKKYKLKPSFQHVLKTIYRADSVALDFGNKNEEEVAEINTWVKNATNGLIKESVPNHLINNKNTVLILANALYFKGTWAEPFLPVRNVTKSFYTLDGNMVQVPYLTEYSLVYSYGSSQGCKILKLPYKVGNQKELSFSISFFLPDEKDGLHDLLKRLSSDSALLKFKFNQVRMRKIRIPKFKLEYNMEVSDMMEQMGLRLNLKKDSEMLEDTDPNTVEDMKVCHSCCVEVGENGCEPLAVQTFDTSTRDVPPHTVFIADHPFMFMIREDSSETPIFLGAVVNPLLQ